MSAVLKNLQVCEDEAEYMEEIQDAPSFLGEKLT